MKLLYPVRVALAYGLTLLVPVATITIWFLTLGRKDLAWLWTCKPWANGVLALIGAKVEVHGVENLQGPAIFVTNHQSLIDVIIMPAILPKTTKFVAKRELLLVPLWGVGFAVSGAILINRKDPRGAVSAVRRGIKQLPKGWSVTVFPEGTRSKDGQIQRFKKGAAHMASEAELPVVPIGLEGAAPLMPKGAFLPRPGKVVVTAGTPIPSEGKSAAELTEEARARVVELREISAQRLRTSQNGAEWQMAPDSVA